MKSNNHRSSHGSDLEASVSAEYSQREIQRINRRLRGVSEEKIRYYNEETKMNTMLRTQGLISKLTEYTATYKFIKSVFRSGKLKQAEERIESISRQVKRQDEIADITIEIYDKTHKRDASALELENMRIKLRKVYFRRTKENNGTERDIYNYLFQYPQYAKTEYYKVVNRIKTEDGSYGICIGKFMEYGGNYPVLTKKIMKELGKSYIRNSEDRKLGLIAAVTFGFIRSFNETCKYRVEQLGESIGWDRDKSLEYVGIINLM